MGNPYIGEIRMFGGQLCAAGLGVLRRPTLGHRRK